MWLKEFFLTVLVAGVVVGGAWVVHFTFAGQSHNCAPRLKSNPDGQSATTNELVVALHLINFAQSYGYDWKIFELHACKIIKLKIKIIVSLANYYLMENDWWDVLR